MRRFDKVNKSLNKAQKEAVDFKNGPMLVVAGAGTGKTSVIVERLVKLIESGVDRKNILALTFTEKAAQEMLDRASDRLQQSYGVELNIYTFNAFGQSLLSEFAIEIGMSTTLRLIGDNGKVVLLREHLDELGLDYFAPISKPDRQLADIADYFSKLKQQLVKPEEYLAYAKGLPAGDENEKLNKKRHTELASAFSKYLEFSRISNVIDYDDQLYLLVELLEKRPNILTLLQERYRYIMVDEFQDTNPMQSRLIDLLAGKDANIFAVGDDDQSIYGWRGATLANILEFTKRYPSAKQVTLIDNYRSTQEILDSAWRLIQYNNPERLEFINKLDKKLRAFRGNGKIPELHKFSRLDAELNWLAEDIKKRIKNGIDPGSIAVLARSKNTVERIHQMLESSGVEHNVAGVTNDLYRHPAISMMLEALRAVAQPTNNTALFHTLGSQLFNCDPIILSQSVAKARGEHEDLETVLSKNKNEHIQNSLKLMHTWRQSQSEQFVRSISYNILTESGLKDKLYVNAEKDIETAQTVQALGQWFSSLHEFEQISRLPSTLNYLDNIEVLQAEGETLTDDTVNITSDIPVVMTAHKAKGLEWSIVYIVDCTENSFPSRRFGISLAIPAALSKTTTADDHYQEERRLMYVAATRARDELIVTHSESHNGVTKRKPSRFIEEMFGVSDGKLSPSDKLVGLEILNGSSLVSTNVPLPANLRENNNLVLTASQADDYLNCPLNFYYKHVLNVPEIPSANTAVGSLFHGLIQDINAAKIAGKSLPDLKSQLSRLESEWPVVGYISKAQRNRALKAGLKAFEALHVRAAKDAIPVAVEQPFRIHIPESKLILKGRIDAVLDLGKGVEIRDYKTSANVDSPEKAKSRATSSNQLTMYALAWRLVQNEEPIQVSLDFVQTGQIGIVKKRASSLDGMQSKLSVAADEILSGKFPPGKSHDFCTHPL